MSHENELWGVTQGILLLFFIHVLALLAIYALSFVLQEIYGGYTVLGVWLFGFGGFSIWQLLYAIPIYIWLKRKRKRLMLKGVIIGVVITILLNGSCFLIFVR